MARTINYFQKVAGNTARTNLRTSKHNMTVRRRLASNAKKYLKNMQDEKESKMEVIDLLGD